jgi:hypothetical protein
MTLLPLTYMYVLQYLGNRDSVSNGEKGLKIKLSFHQEKSFFPLAVFFVQNRYNTRNGPGPCMYVFTVECKMHILLKDNLHCSPIPCFFRLMASFVNLLVSSLGLVASYWTLVWFRGLQP